MVLSIRGSLGDRALSEDEELGGRENQPGIARKVL